MFEILAAPAVNQLLRANTWALEKLRPHAGKTALLTCPPLELRFTVLDTGEVAAVRSEAPADVSISVTPGILVRLAANDTSAAAAAQVTGDTEFAAAIDYLRRNLRWDYEEDLSRVFGDIAAHRIGSAVRGLDTWARSSLFNLGQSFAEYATYEQPIIASGPALENFCRDVDEVRDHASRLEKRIELLRRALEAPAVKPPSDRE